MLDLLLVFTTIILIIWLIKSSSHPKHYPPGPRLPLPIIGDAYMIGSDFASGFCSMIKKYGKVIGLWLGPDRVVIISDFDILQEILNKNETSGRQMTKASGTIYILSLKIIISHLLMFYIKGVYRRGWSLGGTPGVIFSSGITWFELRKSSLQILKDFGVGKNILEDIIEEEVDNLIQHIDDNWINVPLDVSKFFNIAVLASLWRIISGETLKIGDPKLDFLISKVDNIVTETSSVFGAISMVSVPLFKFMNMVGLLNVVKSANELFKYCTKILKIHRDKFIDGDNPLTFIEALLHKIDLIDDPSHPLYGNTGELNLLNTLLDLFIAGSDTTSNTLNWAMLFMIQNPDDQVKVREELLKNIGFKKAKMSERNLTPYTEAVLHEISRRGNIAPMALFHQTNEPITFDQFKIPSKTVIVPMIGEIMHDSNHFPCPNNFDPQRYLTKNEDGDVIFKPNPRVVPFGIGKRRCLGEVIARTSMYKFFTAIIQKYSIVSGQDEIILDQQNGGIICGPKPYKLKFMKIEN